MTYKESHILAQQRGELGYLDPSSGLFVMTENYLRSRGKCCGNGCRHCPFGRGHLDATPTEFLEIVLPPHDSKIPSNAIFLFWSGGKDSYLAYLELKKLQQDIVLVTTYANGIVGHQQIPIGEIKSQAAHLELPLLLIPLRSNQRYEAQINTAILPYEPAHLAFGDLHLSGIRDWREKYFSRFSLLFPIWKVSYTALADILFRSEATISISALSDLFPSHVQVCVGDPYTPELLNYFNELGIDSFGENGEFHTLVQFNSTVS